MPKRGKRQFPSGPRETKNRVFGHGTDRGAWHADKKEKPPPERRRRGRAKTKGVKIKKIERQAQN